MEVVSRMFVESADYMLWREPRTWKMVSHMGDDLYATTLAALLRCELSAQQLLILHSEARTQSDRARSDRARVLMPCHAMPCHAMGRVCHAMLCGRVAGA